MQANSRDTICRLQMLWWPSGFPPEFTLCMRARAYCPLYLKYNGRLFVIIRSIARIVLLVENQRGSVWMHELLKLRFMHYFRLPLNSATVPLVNAFRRSVQPTQAPCGNWQKLIFVKHAIPAATVAH